MSQMEPKPLPKDDMPSETRMQSTTERSRRDRNRIPLDVKFEILQVLFDSVDASTTEASAKSHEASDQATALSLHESRFELRRWSLNLKILMQKADHPLDNLRIFGKLDGPLAATVLNVLDEIENDLRKLSADTTDNKLYAQFISWDMSSSGRTNSFCTGFSVSNFAQYVAESNPRSIVC